MKGSSIRAITPGMHLLLDHLEHKKHVIWDWNGTLLDDVDLAVAAIGEVLEANGRPPIDRETYRNTFCFPIPEYYRRLGFSVEPTSFESLTRQFVASYRKRIPACRLHEGTEAVLATLWGRATQSILSAAHEGDLRALLVRYGIDGYFHHVYGLSDHFAVSKVERGRELMGAAAVEPADTVLIGDTDHDWEVGRALGIEVILLGDGHQHADRLRDLGARLITSRR